MTDRKHDPDELLAAGWHMCCYSYKLSGKEREFRVVLANSVVGKKVFGFGSSFAEALAQAAEQV